MVVKLGPGDRFMRPMLKPAKAGFTIRNIRPRVFWALVFFLVFGARPAWAEHAVFKAVRIQDTADVRRVLDADPAALTSRDRHGSTPLHWAAWRGHEKIVQHLVDRGAEVNARNDQYGTTPLHDAARRGRMLVVEILLIHGADPVIGDNLGRTPLDMARERNQRPVVQLLERHLKTRNIIRDSPLSSHPILTAARRGDIALVREIVDKEPGSVQAEDRVNYQDANLGVTLFRPLHWAAWSGRADVAALLMDLGANPGDRDSWGATPLHHAAGRGNSEVLALLINRGAYVRARDDDRRTPLHWAARGDSVHRGDVSADGVRRLIEAGADPNARDRLGETPLVLALREGNAEAAFVLRSAGGHR